MTQTEILGVVGSGSRGQQILVTDFIQNSESPLFQNQILETRENLFPFLSL